MIGFDKYSINHQLLFGPTFEEMVRLLAHDRAKPAHPLTLTGTPPTWHSLPSGFPYIQLDGAADFLECPAAAVGDLEFTAEDFSLAIWLNADTLGLGSNCVLGINETDVSGWLWFMTQNAPAGNYLSLRTNQNGAHTDCYASGFAVNRWMLLGIVRVGAAAQMYRDGQPKLTTHGIGGLDDPVDPAGTQKLLIGVQFDEATRFFDGGLALPRIWNRALSASEMRQIFELERHWFGV